ncbi:MAG TPA: Abi-alpha family protein [Candidatus Acidoferrum sp.]|jgi:hypothetical protein|nr:Abi-alpha family protein [Candidatus Acidoferrum sp.]
MIPVPLPNEQPQEDKEATSLLKKFLGPAVEEIGEILADRVRVVRLRRQLALLRKADQIVADAGFSLKAVNLRVLFPLLEAAAVEDDEEMAERWASLLASAANASNRDALEPAFIEILKQLAPSHAFLLDVFYDQIKSKQIPPAQWPEKGPALNELRTFLKKEIPEFDVAVENLLRLNLVSYPTAKLGIANGNEVRVQIMSADILCATGLGYAFASACGHGRTPRDKGYGVPTDSISNRFWTRGGSLRLTPAPPAKAVPPGMIPPEEVQRIQTEALAIAEKFGYPASVGLTGRIVQLHLRSKPLPPEVILPFIEFCAERALQPEIHYR